LSAHHGTIALVASGQAVGYQGLIAQTVLPSYNHHPPHMRKI
ncbi:hypothetical protein CI238_01188, partial [Colletotrichum incanum]